MSRTTNEILENIQDLTGNGDTAQGFALFESEALHNEHLHQTYDYCAAVRYLMRIRPDDAKWIEQETGVET